jgi:Mn-dependent DtxR family transcriptional regulator
MPYERSREIEQRFETTISLIAEKKLNSRELASQLGVSIPTAQRIIAELKRRGYKIRSVRDESGWYYEITENRTN